MTFRRPGDEPGQAKAQTQISPHLADVLMGDRARILISLHPEKEVEEVQIRISLLPGRGHREDVDRTQTCLHHGEEALLMDLQ